MAVDCPRCATRVPVRAAIGSGQVFSPQGRIVHGDLTASGDAVMSDIPLRAAYRLSSSRYTIAVCDECKAEFIAETVSGRTRVVHPIAHKPVSRQIPESIRKAFEDALLAHSAGAEIASVLAARTALIRMQREQNCSRINDLVTGGKITALLSHQANEIRLWANVWGHEEVIDLAPSSEDVEQLLEYLSILFDVLYEQPAKLREIQAKRAAVRSSSSA